MMVVGEVVPFYESGMMVEECTEDRVREEGERGEVVVNTGGERGSGGHEHCNIGGDESGNELNGDRDEGSLVRF